MLPENVTCNNLIHFNSFSYCNAIYIYALWNALMQMKKLITKQNI